MFHFENIRHRKLILVNKERHSFQAVWTTVVSLSPLFQLKLPHPPPERRFYFIIIIYIFFLEKQEGLYSFTLKKKKSILSPFITHDDDDYKYCYCFYSTDWLSDWCTHVEIQCLARGVNFLEELWAYIYKGISVSRNKSPSRPTEISGFLR